MGTPTVEEGDEGVVEEEPLLSQVCCLCSLQHSPWVILGGQGVDGGAMCQLFECVGYTQHLVLLWAVCISGGDEEEAEQTPARNSDSTSSQAERKEDEEQEEEIVVTSVVAVPVSDPAQDPILCVSAGDQVLAWPLRRTLIAEEGTQVVGEETPQVVSSEDIAQTLFRVGRGVEINQMCVHSTAKEGGKTLLLLADDNGTVTVLQLDMCQDGDPPIVTASVLHVFPLHSNISLGLHVLPSDRSLRCVFVSSSLDGTCCLSQADPPACLLSLDMLTLLRNPCSQFLVNPPYVHSCAVVDPSGDGSALCVLCGCEDGTLTCTVVEAASPNKAKTHNLLFAHRSAVTQICLLHDWKEDILVLTCGMDCRVRLWSLRHLQENPLCPGDLQGVGPDVEDINAALPMAQPLWEAEMLGKVNCIHWASHIQSVVVGMVSGDSRIIPLMFHADRASTPS